MEIHQTFSQRGKSPKKLEVGAGRDTREVYLEELRVLLAVGIRLEDGVDVVEDVLGRKLRARRFGERP